MTVFTLASNLQVSVPIATPVITVPAGTTTISFDAKLTAPVQAGTAITVIVETSSDGGTTFTDVFSASLAGGPPKGVGPSEIGGTIRSLNPGDQLRLRATSVTGTWTVISATITAT